MASKVNDVKIMLRNREYQEINKIWNELSSDERLEVMKHSFQIKRYKPEEKDWFFEEYLISEEHFRVWYSDRVMIKERIQELARKFELSEFALDNIKYGFYKGSYRAESVRMVALYFRLQGYQELMEKYDCITPELLKNNPTIFECAPLRTEARLRFLLEQKPEITEDEFVQDLTAYTPDFNRKYQEALVKKFNEFEQAQRGSEAEIVGVKTGDSIIENSFTQKQIDKALEKMLTRIYLRKTPEEMAVEGAVKTPDVSSSEADVSENKSIKYIIKTIEDEKGNITSVRVPMGEEINPEQLLSERLAEGIKSRVSSLDFEDVYDTFRVPFIGEMLLQDSGKGRCVSWRSKEGNLEERLPLNKRAIGQYLKTLKDIGIECEGYFALRGGRKAYQEDEVYFYIFGSEQLGRAGNHGMDETKEKKTQYKICEPIGQVANRTYVVYLEVGEEIEEILSNNTLPGLVEQGKAFRLNHERENGQYQFFPMRIPNLIQLIKEGKKEVSQEWSLSRVKEEIVQEVSKEELPEAAQYIQLFSKPRARNIINKVKEIERSNKKKEMTDLGEME